VAGADVNPPRWLPAALAAAIGLVLAVFLMLTLTSGSSEDDAAASTAPSSAEERPDATGTPATVAVQPDGFEVVTLRSTQPDGTVSEWCVWHADTRDQRAQGLQEVTDLGEPVGMAFSYDEPVNNTYHMHNTRMALSIAWFGRSGLLVGATDMVPCEEDDRSDCPRYAPGEEYVLAVEVPRGELDRYGLITGSTAELLDQPCP
jgi:uncharacterized membrane protein (UPF0127 family)